MVLNTGLRIRINIIRIQIQLFTSMWIRIRILILLLNKVIDLQTATVRVHGPPRLDFEPLKPLKFIQCRSGFRIRIPVFLFNADPGPFSKINANPCGFGSAILVKYLTGICLYT
jgi:hypothetical protein